MQNNLRSVSLVLLASMLVCIPSISDAGEAEGITSIMSDYIGGLTISEDTKIDKLINKQEQSQTRRGLIIHFCDTFLNKGPGADNGAIMYFDHAGYRYDPRQSMFMYALCVLEDEANTDNDYTPRDYKSTFTFEYKGEGESDMQKLLTDNVKKKDQLYGIRGVEKRSVGSRHECDPSHEMQSCNFSSFLPHIFKIIMNDISNVKLATLYGATEGTKEEERKEAIRKFAVSYYGEYPEEESQGMVPCRDPDTHYLSDKMLEGDQKHCSHPKTYKLVDEVIKSAHGLLTDNDMLDGEKTIKEECTDHKTNLYVCAFENYGEYFADSDWRAFQNLYLNEFMYYSLFADYYMNQLRYNVKYAPISNKPVSDLAQLMREEVDNMYFELQISQKAAEQMTRMLTHVASTYPLHVSLMAYLEDVINYRRTLINVYSPVNQLFYTWRNVQACGE